MKRLSLLALMLAALTVPAGAGASGPPMTPAQAIAQARALAPKGLSGTFEMRVASIELYATSPRLHSEADHENGRALSVHVSEAAHRQLVNRLGADYVRTLKGRTIRVTGTAKRFHVAAMMAGEPGREFENTIIQLPDAGVLQVL